MNTPKRTPQDSWTPEFSRWRHGGWYVCNVHYPGGAVGCVSNNYEDGKWRIACDPRAFEERPTFKNRTAAARAEKQYVEDNWEALKKKHEAFLGSLRPLQAL